MSAPRGLTRLSLTNFLQSKKSRDLYAKFTISLLQFLERNCRDVFAQILYILDEDPVITYYLIFEPYKKDGEFIISDTYLFQPDTKDDDSSDEEEIGTDKQPKILKGVTFWDWVPYKPSNERKGTASKEYVEYIKKITPKKVPKTNKLQSSTLNDSDDPISMIEKIQECYSKVLKHEKVNLPYSVEQKMWQDEFRFFMKYAMKNKQSIFDVIPNYIGDSYKNEIELLNIDKYNQSLSTTERFDAIKNFVESDCYLYLLR